MILSFSSPLALVQELRKASGISCTSRAPMLEILANTGPVLAHEVLNLILDQKNQTDWIWEHGRNQMVQTLRREISWRLFDALSDQEKTMVAQRSEFLYSWMSRVQMDVVHIDTLVLALNDKDHPISEQTRRAWLNSISVYFWSQKALSDEHIAQLLPENDRLPFLDFANSPMNSFDRLCLGAGHSLSATMDVLTSMDAAQKADVLNGILHMKANWVWDSTYNGTTVRPWTRGFDV